MPEDSSHIIITIAREYGSGGREIGLKVAQALKIPFYDRELIAMEARECGLSSDYVESTEEAFLCGIPHGTGPLKAMVPLRPIFLPPEI